MITIERLAKRYRIGRRTHVPSNVRRSIAARVTRPWRGFRRRPHDTFLALDDVNLRVEPGEVVGVIGRNGSGKSTLLKILSRITEPTAGRVEMHGRVGSLLEVGTGFHPELTGRENIFLNGAILGMSRREIRTKFDEIVDFAGIDRFLDTPVKRYSSGMYVRLGFAVAAHLEPEILLVDEVLAVGDAAFQHKCLGKMADIASGGRTILFVTHNMTAVSNLCRRAILLDSGRVRAQGKTPEVVSAYAASLDHESAAVPINDRTDRDGTGVLRFVGFELRAGTRTATDTVCTGESVELIVDYETRDGRELQNASFAIPFYNHFGQHMLMCWTRLVGQDCRHLPPRGRLVATIPEFPLPEGRYSINLWSEVNGTIADWVKQAFTVAVVGGDFFGTGQMTPSGHNGVLVKHGWDLHES